MRRLLLAMLVGVLGVSPAAAACRWTGLQLECDLGSARLVFGTLAGDAPQTSSLPIYSFQGNVGLGDARSSADPDRLEIDVQRFGVDADSCHRFGDETYCY